MVNLFHKEMTINLEEQRNKLLINRGFFSFLTNPSPLHSHYYAELHLFARGGGVYATTEKEYVVREGELLVFPAGVYHSCRSILPNSQHIDFQITDTIEEVVQQPLPSGIAPALFAEITRLGENRTSERLRAYLSLLCAEAKGNSGDEPLTVIDDRAFLIHEYMTRNYNRDISLADIAKFLCLSEKQTGRLIRQYTGLHFKDALTRYRIEAAKQMIEAKNLPLSKIAELVGYHSYSGFWKAFNAYRDE
ncbi:MAG: helix-turn-helix domain-containing protein [Clostridia bacterium]|nr:helix-turn-helix domain-containing protein [Clostridia bacterium]